MLPARQGYGNLFFDTTKHLNNNKLNCSMRLKWTYTRYCDLFFQTKRVRIVLEFVFLLEYDFIVFVILNFFAPPHSHLQSFEILTIFFLAYYTLFVTYFPIAPEIHIIIYMYFIMYVWLLTCELLFSFIFHLA